MMWAPATGAKPLETVSHVDVEKYLENGLRLRGMKPHFSKGVSLVMRPTVSILMGP